MWEWDGRRKTTIEALKLGSSAAGTLITNQQYPYINAEGRN